MVCRRLFTRVKRISYDIMLLPFQHVPVSHTIPQYTQILVKAVMGTEMSYQGICKLNQSTEIFGKNLKMETEHLFQFGHTHFTELTKSFPAISTELETQNIKEKTKFSANLPIQGQSRSRTQTGLFHAPSLQDQISCFLYVHMQIFPCRGFSDKNQNKNNL